ncbi:hypothetical protein V1511DRAFT_495568 [Dipodascopsis uninucleata]
MKYFKRNDIKDPHVAVVDAITQFCDKKYDPKGKRSFSLGMKLGSKPEKSKESNGDEVIYLPTIVDCAQATPAAAREAIRAVRKRIDPKHGSGSVTQYNAIMVLRILIDTDSIAVQEAIGSDDKLAPILKTVLKNSRDPSIVDFLRDTLVRCASTKGDVEGFSALHSIYYKYLAKGRSKNSRKQQLSEIKVRSLQERIDDMVQECRESANLLEQIVSTTPPASIAGSTLVFEFYQRCDTLEKEVTRYLNDDSSHIDEQRMVKLIESNDALKAALNAHKLALDRASALTSPPREYYESESKLMTDARHSLEYYGEGSGSSSPSITKEDLSVIPYIENNHETDEISSSDTGVPSSSIFISRDIANPFEDDDQESLWDSPVARTPVNATLPTTRRQTSAIV